MKSVTTIVITVLTAVMLTNTVYAQKSFGVRIGGPTQSYYVGFFEFGSIKPIVGLDYFSGSINVDYTYHYEENYNGDRNVDDDESSVDGSLRLFIPRVGVKYFRAPKKDLISYLLAEGFIVVPTVSFETMVDGETETLDKDDEARIKDALDFIGITLGLGTEYYFSDQFSIGGEAGINWLLWDFKEEYSDSYESPNYSWSEKSKLEIKATLSGVYARMSINFFF